MIKFSTCTDCGGPAQLSGRYIDMKRYCDPCAEAVIRRKAAHIDAQVATAKPQPEGSDPVNHPAHYTGHPSGVECIRITEHVNFCLGNALKYIWRAGLKGDAIEDLEKARWYHDREIARRREGGAA